MPSCGDSCTGRCLACRAALSAYKSARRSQPIGTVAAAAAQAHLSQLAALGLGIRQIAAQAGLSARHVARVKRLDRIRPDTAARLLAVRPVLARGAMIPGTRTHRFIDSLRREGFTKQAIAFHLGQRSQQLQLSRRVRVSSALKVAAVYSQLTV